MSHLLLREEDDFIVSVELPGLKKYNLKKHDEEHEDLGKTKIRNSHHF